jgi:hypothetical protein
MTHDEQLARDLERLKALQAKIARQTAQRKDRELRDKKRHLWQLAQALDAAGLGAESVATLQPYFKDIAVMLALKTAGAAPDVLPLQVEVSVGNSEVGSCLPSSRS